MICLIDVIVVVEMMLVTIFQANGGHLSQLVCRVSCTLSSLLLSSSPLSLNRKHVTNS